ncbi:MAG: peptidase M24, partial [Asticcacaulis sp. 32-58-5]
MVFATAAALTVGTLIWRVFQPTPGILPGMALDPNAVMALETQAFAAAAARPGFDQPEQVSILVRSGETLSQAIARTGVAPADAQAAVNLLSQAFDVVNVRAGMSIQAAIAKPAPGSREP